MASTPEEDGIKARARAQQVALFRYQVICPALDPDLSTKARGPIVRAIAARTHSCRPVRWATHLFPRHLGPVDPPLPGGWFRGPSTSTNRTPVGRTRSTLRRQAPCSTRWSAARVRVTHGTRDHSSLRVKHARLPGRSQATSART